MLDMKRCALSFQKDHTMDFCVDAKARCQHHSLYLPSNPNLYDIYRLRGIHDVSLKMDLGEHAFTVQVTNDITDC